MKKKNIVEIISALFILLFMYTALNKLYEPGRFRWVLNNSPLIKDFAGFVTYAVPIAELTLATLLFFPKSRKIGLYGSLGIMTVFTLYIGYMIAFTPNLPCSCGGVLQQMTWTQHLLFNMFFTLLALMAILFQRRIPVQGYAATAAPRYT